MVDRGRVAAGSWAGGVNARLAWDVLCRGRKYPSLLIWCGCGGVPMPVPARPIVARVGRGVSVAREGTNSVERSSL